MIRRVEIGFHVDPLFVVETNFDGSGRLNQTGARQVFTLTVVQEFGSVEAVNAAANEVRARGTMLDAKALCDGFLAEQRKGKTGVCGLCRKRLRLDSRGNLLPHTADAEVRERPAKARRGRSRSVLEIE